MESSSLNSSPTLGVISKGQSIKFKGNLLPSPLSFAEADGKIVPGSVREPENVRTGKIEHVNAGELHNRSNTLHSNNQLPQTRIVSIPNTISYSAVNGVSANKQIHTSEGARSSKVKGLHLRRQSITELAVVARIRPPISEDFQYYVGEDEFSICTRCESDPRRLSLIRMQEERDFFLDRILQMQEDQEAMYQAVGHEIVQVCLQFLPSITTTLRASWTAIMEPSWLMDRHLSEHCELLKGNRQEVAKPIRYLGTSSLP
jgi:hypothetical protein